MVLMLHQRIFKVLINLNYCSSQDTFLSWNIKTKVNVANISDRNSCCPKLKTALHWPPGLFMKLWILYESLRGFLKEEIKGSQCFSIRVEMYILHFILMFYYHFIKAVSKQITAYEYSPTLTNTIQIVLLLHF